MGLPRFAARRDSNEPALVQLLEAHGALVQPFSMKGFPDLGVFHKGNLLLAEVKVPGEPFSEEQISTFEKIMAKGVPVYVLETAEDVLALLRGEGRVFIREGIAVWSRSGGRQKRAHRPGKSRARTVEELCIADCCPLSSLNGRRGPCVKHAEQAYSSGSS